MEHSPPQALPWSYCIIALHKATKQRRWNKFMSYRRPPVFRYKYWIYIFFFIRRPCWHHCKCGALRWLLQRPRFSLQKHIRQAMFFTYRALQAVKTVPIWGLQNLLGSVAARTARTCSTRISMKQRVGDFLGKPSPPGWFADDPAFDKESVATRALKISGFVGRDRSCLLAKGRKRCTRGRWRCI